MRIGLRNYSNLELQSPLTLLTRGDPYQLKVWVERFQVCHWYYLRIL
jgi:hypothetical protein